MFRDVVNGSCEAMDKGLLRIVGHEMKVVQMFASINFTTHSNLLPVLPLTNVGACGREIVESHYIMIELH